jgi:hypothetical protein
MEIKSDAKKISVLFTVSCVLWACFHPVMAQYKTIRIKYTNMSQHINVQQKKKKGYFIYIQTNFTGKNG